MELENELFLATIEWTWECCLKQKDSDNKKSVALCKAYKGGQFGLLQVDQTDEQGKIEYRKVLPYRYDNIIYLGCGIFCLFQRHQHWLKRLFLTKNYDIRAEDIGYGPYSGLAWMDRSDIVIYRNSLNKFRTAEKSTMKNRSVQYLRNCCENALRELYPAGIPRGIPTV